MSANKFAKGDLVADTTRYGAGLEKHHIADVVAVGARGVQVHFRGKRLPEWVHAGKLRFVVGVDGNNTTVLSDERPPVAERPSRPPPRRDSNSSAAPVAETAPPAPPPPSHVSLDALMSAGVDPLELLIALGRELTSREERAIAAAEAAVRSADAEVTAAETILADAREGATRARAALDAARARLIAVSRCAGGAL